MEITAKSDAETKQQLDDIMCCSHYKNTYSYRLLQRDVADIFNSLQEFTDLPNFTKHISGEAFMEEMKDIGKHLDSRKNDLMKGDCAIVIAGETSAGKSSVINLMIGEEILPTDITATTTRICRLRYSEKLRISRRDSEERQLHVTEFENKEKLADELSDLATTDDGEIKYVDVCLPVEILKGNIVIVDTPGIGDEDQEVVTRMMMDYIPNAVAFVFVVNMGNAGGLQKDRLGRIFERVRDISNQMHSFDPKDAIFLLNKWDTMKQKNRKLDLFEDMKMKLHNLWKDVEDGYILKFAATEVDENEVFQREFDRLQQILKSIIAKNENKRIKVHIEFIRSFLEKCDVVVTGKINCARQKTEENVNTIDNLSRELEVTECKRQEVFKNLQQNVDMFLEKATKALQEYIHSHEFKIRILQDIEQFTRFKIGSEIESRIVKETYVWQELNVEEMFRKEVMETMMEKFIEIHESLHTIAEKVKGFTPAFNVEKNVASPYTSFVPSGTFIAGSILMTFLSVNSPATIVFAATGFLISGLAAIGIMDDVETTIQNAYKASIERYTTDNIKQSLSEKYAKGLERTIQGFLEGPLKEEIDKLILAVSSMRKSVDYYQTEESNLISLSSAISKIRNRLEELESNILKIN